MSKSELMAPSKIWNTEKHQPILYKALRLGRSSQTIVGRLLRSWDSRNFKRDGKLMGITLVFVDEKSAVIHGSIPASHADQFRSVLREGDIYTIKEFEIRRCMQHYKITKHPYLIRFLPATSISKNESFDKQIVEQKFMLRGIEELTLLANTNSELPDVVGLIRCVQGSNLEDASSMQHLVVRFQISLTETVSVTLWDDAAATFRSHVPSQKTKQTVMVVTSINPKLFGGRLFLNSTSGTRFYFDKEIDSIQQFVKSLGNETELSFRCVDTRNGIKKKELLPINELHNYVCNSDAQTQEAKFICETNASEVSSKNGWTYVCCGRCSRKLEEYGTQLRCSRCVSSNISGVVRGRVELGVQDDSDGATFGVDMGTYFPEPTDTVNASHVPVNTVGIILAHRSHMQPEIATDLVNGLDDYNDDDFSNAATSCFPSPSTRNAGT